METGHSLPKKVAYAVDTKQTLQSPADCRLNSTSPFGRHIPAIRYLYIRKIHAK
jgi:hypothetical protein